MSAGFWRGRRVFLTGHTGFKGTWLALWLERLGAEVTGYALAPEVPSLYRQVAGDGHLKSLIGDVRDAGAVLGAMREARPELVLHFAAQALVRPSYEDPLGTYATNVMGTAHVLDAIRHVEGVRAALIVTSDKCYENQEWAWPYRENDRLGGFDPYSNSKGCAELVTSAYVRSFLEKRGVKVATARAGNVIGGGDWAKDRLIPDAVRAFADGKKVRLRNPLATRPWQHVLEPLGAYLRIARALLEGTEGAASAWNVGPDAADARSVSEVIGLLAPHFGPHAGWEKDGDEHPHEARALALDSSRLRAALGWTPRLTLAEAVAWTARWYRDVGAGARALDATLADLERYEARG